MLNFAAPAREALCESAPGVPREAAAKRVASEGVALEVLHVHLGDAFIPVVAAGGAGCFRGVKPHSGFGHIAPSVQLLEGPPHVHVVPAHNTAQESVA